MKKRKTFKPATLKILQKEIASVCPFCPSDEVEIFEIHHIDENPDNNELSNLLMLCPACHTKITKGFIKPKEVIEIKIQLSRPQRKVPKVLYDLGEDAWKNRNSALYDKAVEQLQTGIEKSKDIQDEFSETYFNFYLAIILDEKYHKTDEAVELMLNCIQILKKYGEIKKIIDAYSALTNFEVRREKILQAKSYAKKAFKLTELISAFNKYHFVDLADRHLKLGWVEHHFGNYKDALQEYNTGLILLISEEIKDDAATEKIRKQMIAGAYQHIGLSYERMGNSMNAKEVFLKSANTFREINFEIDLAKVLYHLAHAHFRDAEYSEGETYLTEAAALYLKMDEYAEYVRCIDLKGRLYYTLGEEEKAYKIFIDCCNILEEHQANLKLLEEFYHKVGDIFYMKDDFEKAAEYYIKLKKLSERNNDFLGISIALHALANIENKKGNKHVYERLILEAISVLSDSLPKVESEEKKAFVIGTIGSYYIILENYQEALRFFSKAKDIYEQKQLISGLARCMGEIARIYHLQKRENEAFDMMRNMKKIVDGSTNYELIAGSAITLADYQIKLGNYQAAEVLYQEAQFLNKKYNFPYTNDLKDLKRSINYAIEINKPVEISFEELLNDLFGLMQWFPEAKESIFRMWFSCRKEEIFGSIKALHGVKLMICEDDITQFTNHAKSLHCYTDISFQVISDDFPDSITETVPFPVNKVFYPKMAILSQKKVAGDFEYNIDEIIGARYIFYGGKKLTSKLTGNKGTPVIGWSPGLPVQAYELILNSKAKSFIDGKMFFFPHERHKANDKLLSDLHISKLYDFIPVYSKVLPGSNFVTSLEYFDFKIPISAKGNETKIIKYLSKFKSLLKKLATSNKTKWRDVLNDFKNEMEEINRILKSSPVISLRIQLLEYHGLLEKEYSTVLIIK